MIFSSINSKDDFTSYPKAVQRAIKYLKENDFVNMEPGVYELEGKLMYAQVFDAETGSVNEKRPEVHEKYLDVQFLASGREKLGFTPDTGNYEMKNLMKEILFSTNQQKMKDLLHQHQDASVYFSQQMFTDQHVLMESL